MKITKLIAIIPLVSVLTIGSAFAQGNPHQDPTFVNQQLAKIQGNPHIGFEVQPRIIADYRGNPHEGYISQVIQIADIAKG